MTIKTTIALEFGNRRHRDEFLRAFQTMLFTFGNKSPKVAVTMTQKTEAEFGDPSALDLFFCGVEVPEPLTPIERLIPAEGASFDPVPPTLCERVLHALAAHGPMPAATLAVKVEADAEDVRGELERLHALGDVEPDDGDVWRLADGE